MQIENHKEEVPFGHYEALFAAANAQKSDITLHIFGVIGSFEKNRAVGVKNHWILGRRDSRLIKTSRIPTSL